MNTIEAMSKWMFPVGSYIAEELAAREWTSAMAASRISSTDKELQINTLWLDLMCCQPIWFEHDIKFTLEDAVRLATILGVNAETLLRLDREFQRKKVAWIAEHGPVTEATK